MPERKRYSKKHRKWVPYDEWLAKRGMKRADAPRRKAASSKPRSVRTDMTSKGGISRYRGVGQAIGGAIGTAIGGAPGMLIGDMIGGVGADLIKSVTGFGDYKVEYNTVLYPDQVPQFRDRGRSVVINHREYIRDIISSGVAGQFNINSLLINPGDPSTFPWLNSIAQQFEEYRVHGMIFEYKTTSSDALNSVNTALGTVVLATQYNSIAPVFSNKQQMENYEFGASCKPSCSLMHAIECDPKVTSFGPIFTVRVGAGTDTGDVRLYDLGRFSIATVGMQGTNVNIGELWCTYSIEFFKPRQSSTYFAAHWTLGDGSFSGSISTVNTFNNAVLTSTSANNTGITFPSINTIQIPNSFTGNLALTYSVFGTSGSTGTSQDPNIVPSLGCTGLRLLNQDSLYFVQSGYPAGDTAMQTAAYFHCVNGGVITFTGGTFPGGIVIGDLIIVSFDNDLLN